MQKLGGNSHTLWLSLQYFPEKNCTYDAVHHERYAEGKFPPVSRIFFLFSIISGLEFVISSRVFTFVYRQVIFISAFCPANKEKWVKYEKPSY